MLLGVEVGFGGGMLVEREREEDGTIGRSESSGRGRLCQYKRCLVLESG